MFKKDGIDIDKSVSDLIPTDLSPELRFLQNFVIDLTKTGNKEMIAQELNRLKIVFETEIISKIKNEKDERKMSEYLYSLLDKV